VADSDELGEKLVYLRHQIEAFLGPEIGFVLLAAPLSDAPSPQSTDMISVYNVDDALVPYALRSLADAVEQRNRQEQN
jgi:hypothetical protein